MVGPIRATGPPDPLPPSSAASTSASASFTPRRASCEFCRRRKIRCDGQDPCAACTQRKIVCVFKVESPKGRPRRSSRRSIGSSNLRESISAMDTSPDSHLSISTRPQPHLSSGFYIGAIARPAVPHSQVSKTDHNFDIHPEDIATPFWVQLGGRQGTVAAALQDMWGRYFGPRDASGAAHQPASSFLNPAASENLGTVPSDHARSASSQADDGPSVQANQGQAHSESRKGTPFPQTISDIENDEFHWVADFDDSIQLMIQGMVELSCNVYGQLGCSWIGKPFFFVHMMQLDPAQRMFDEESEPGGSNGAINPLDEMSLDRMLSMIEIFFAHHFLAALFSKSMIIDQCREYKLGRRDANNEGSSAADSNEQQQQERRQKQNLPPPSPLLLTTIIAEAIPDSIEDEEDELVVDAARRLRTRLLLYAESLMYKAPIEPVTVGSHSASSPRTSLSSAPSSPSSSASTREARAQERMQRSAGEEKEEGEEDGEDEAALYDLSTIQALVLIGARELCEGTSPRKAACYIGVVARMLSHMRAKERAARLKPGSRGKGKEKEGARMDEAQSSPGTTYRAVNEEIRINVEWFITATSAWFFCQLERPLGSLLPPASILRFPPLRICRSASLQMDKRRLHITSLRRQAQLVEQLWTCATVTVTVCLTHDLHPSNQDAKKSSQGGGPAGDGQTWQEDRLRNPLHQLGRTKVNMLELCERIQHYLDDYLRDMEKNKAPPSALAFLEASFMSIYLHTLFPTMTEADINWNTGLYFRHNTFDLYLAATKRILAALEPWASTSRTSLSQEMFSRRYGGVQKQLANIFVLALDACQRGLTVIVEYLNTETAFGEGTHDGQGHEHGQAERRGSGTKRGEEGAPAQTASGWLMPTRAVLLYISAKAQIETLLEVAEQAQLASGSAFLRVAIHARRVEEGYTLCICQIRQGMQARTSAPRARGASSATATAATAAAAARPTAPEMQMSSAEPSTSSVVSTTATGSVPFGFLMDGHLGGLTAPSMDSAGQVTGMSHLDGVLSSQAGMGMGGGSGSSSSPGGPFSIAGLLAPTGAGPVGGIGPGAGATSGSFLSPPLVGMAPPLGMGTTMTVHNAASGSGFTTGGGGVGGSGDAPQPFAPGDDPLSSLWWNQQASALPLSLPTVTGPALVDAASQFSYSSGWPTTSFSAGPGLATYPGGAMMPPVDTSGSGGMPSTTPEDNNSSNNNNNDNMNLNVNENNQNATNIDGMVSMDTSVWGTATIPDSWLAATFYDNMEALRMSGWNLA
ncbi:hypothetical protein CF336_g3152 [Tilletia laevis]|uniref:Uncharacterized protein n=3 Tax=Tilletia TaxID=13289 RepID=A0A177VBY2_9BASI|nr:hypothetical protein CF336_g3152 [Tilletia laevis]KAE8205372.1 hypothetical protein CF335_g2320 [Tilletia laevis]KAE8262692.1 hypothetical protein A4X03_0g2258 [Tilletia caries]